MWKPVKTARRELYVSPWVGRLLKIHWNARLQPDDRECSSGFRVAGNSGGPGVAGPKNSRADSHSARDRRVNIGLHSRGPQVPFESGDRLPGFFAASALPGGAVYAVARFPGEPPPHPAPGSGACTLHDG